MLKSFEMLGLFLLTRKYTKLGILNISLSVFRNSLGASHKSQRCVMGTQLGLLGRSRNTLQFRRIHKDPQDKKADNKCHKVLWAFRRKQEKLGKLSTASTGSNKRNVIPTSESPGLL